MIPATAPVRPRSGPATWTRLLLVAGLAALDAPGNAERLTTNALLHVEVSGCGAVVAPATCALATDRALRVWVDGPPSVTVSFGTDVGPVSIRERAATARGSRYALTIPLGATTLTASTDGSDRRAASVPLRSLVTAGPVARAKALRAEGKTDEAAALLRASVDSLPAFDAAAATGLLARIEYAAGHADAAGALYELAVARDRESGRVSDAVDDTFARAFPLMMEHHIGEARRLLGSVDDLLPAYADGRVRAIYYRAVLDGETGDLRSSLSAARAAREEAARLGLDAVRRNAIGLEATALGSIGRGDEALARLGEIRDHELDALSPCEQQELFTNIGWIALHGRLPLDPTRLDLAESALDRSAAIARTSCARATNRRYALLNLSGAALARRDLPRTRALLAEADADRPDAPPRLRLEALDTKARLALAEGRAADALAGFRSEAAIATETASVEARWRAALGVGDALERGGRDDEAATAYARAEDILDEGASLVPVIAGADTYLADHEASARSAIETLLRIGRPDEALRAVRRARARGMASLALRSRIASLTGSDRQRWDEAIEAYVRERDAITAEASAEWSLPTAERQSSAVRREERRARLQSALDEAIGIVGRESPSAWGHAFGPAPEGTTVLAYYPLQEGWVAIAQDARGTRAARLGPVDPDAPLATLAETLLAPFDRQLERASAVQVLAGGALARVDFHALPWRGEPLVVHATVTYPLDVPRPPPPERGERGVALIVSNPERNLASASAEVSAVASALRDVYPVRLLEGASADLARVSRELPDAALFHFAGHGRFAGERGWQSGLLLGAGELRVDDVMTLARVPSYVVLSGCETARAPVDAPSEGVGLAQAFALAGSAAVIGTTREVDDSAAAEEIRALYDSIRSMNGEPLDLGGALARAQREVRGRVSDWAAFRALTP